MCLFICFVFVVVVVAAAVVDVGNTRLNNKSQLSTPGLQEHVTQKLQQQEVTNACLYSLQILSFQMHKIKGRCLCYRV